MKSKLIPALIVMALLSFIYSGITSLNFAKVDDQWMLLDDVLVSAPQTNINYINKVFTNINSLQYAPLNTIYYQLIFKIDGYNPFWYHLISVVVHFFNIILVFLVSKVLFKLFNIKNTKALAYMVALIWGVLPFNVETVVWISASKILLFSFFGLLSFLLFSYAYIKKSKPCYFLSILFFCLSFLAKEQAVLLSLMFLSFALCYDNKVSKVNLRSVLKYVIPFFLLSVVFGLITIYAAVYGDGTHNIARYPFSQRIVLTFYCLFFYIVNIFLPFNLHYHYPFPIALGQDLPLRFYFYPLAFVLVVWQLRDIIRKDRNQHFYLFCISIFIIHLLLSIQIFPLARPAIMADRYIYLSAIGPLLMLIARFGGAINFQRPIFKDKIIILSFTIYIIINTYYSHRLVQNWQDLNL